MDQLKKKRGRKPKDKSEKLQQPEKKKEEESPKLKMLMQKLKNH